MFERGGAGLETRKNQFGDDLYFGIIYILG